LGRVPGSGCSVKKRSSIRVIAAHRTRTTLLLP
jgi:hypothetical protein